MRNFWIGGVLLAVSVFATTVGAVEIPWRKAGKTAPVPASAPGVTLGKPIPVSLGRPEPLDSPARTNRVQPAAYVEPTARGQAAESPWVPANLPTLGAPQPAAGSGITTVARTSAAPPPVDPYFVPPAPPPGNPIPPASRFSGPGLCGCEWLGCTSGSGRKMFESDHDFDGFISPVSNPFLFEDPRSLTEVRPILIYQLTPNSNPVYQGGNVWFLGTQARLAVTERLSVVMNKLGWVWSDPNDNAYNVHPHSGFSEIWIGPKLTFWRCDKTCTLAAVGATLQIPVGDSDVYQKTGTLSLAPYISFAQGFARDFHFMSTLGWAIGDNGRTDYFYSSYHLDYDVGGLHKIYPLVELNWVHYTKNGGTIPINFEGRDLINFGAQAISGTDTLTLAVGARYKFSECLQAGMALEFPLIRSDDLINFRVTTDLIWRY